MSDCMVYWKEFWEDVKGNREWGDDYYTRSSHFFNQIRPGDSLWVVVSGGAGNPDGWRLLQQLVVKKLKFERAFYRPYRAVGEPRKSRSFDINSQSDLAPLLRKLDFASGRKLKAKGRAIGNALQAIRPLTDSDKMLLEEYAAKLLRHTPNADSDDRQVIRVLKVGAGFGNPETNRRVECAACSFVMEWYKSRGWRVKSVEAEKCGFDLLCTRGVAEAHVEVKGVQGREPSFIITAGEVRRAQSDPSFILCIVTSALTNDPALHCYTGKRFAANYSLTPLAYRATLNS